MNQAEAKRFVGLDAIRFVCAFEVVMSHNPSLLSLASSSGSRSALVAAKLFRDLFNGSAAVIVFFVISGFCIHWPHRGMKSLGLDYFARRYIRIGVPLAAAVLVSPYFGIPSETLLKTVLWSLYCELVYYTIYPLLLRAAARVGWQSLTVAAFVVAFTWAIVRPNQFGNYTSANVFIDSLLGLPCWLMGCLLASRKPPPAPTRAGIWRWRGAVLVASIFVLELRFHTPLHSDLTLNFFGILTMYWLGRELSYGQKALPWAWLERAGAWSYSLYLFHVAAERIPSMLFPRASYGLQWLMRTPVVLATAYVFYRLFERPSHHLARFLASSLRSKAVAPS